MTAIVSFPSFAADPRQETEQEHYARVVRPILYGNCGSCHTAGDLQGGINLSYFDYIGGITYNGKLFRIVIKSIENGSMSPHSERPLSESEKDTLIIYLEKYLDDALANPNPGIIPPRRLSNREYRYSVYDLLGVKLDTDSLLPADASGGSYMSCIACINHKAIQPQLEHSI
ncbi:MAG: DUF1587 domain-containing protein [Bacteroidota bacterium]